MRASLLLGAAALLLCGATPVFGQDTASPRVVQTPRDSALEARTSDVARQLRCPVCQGLSIQDSPSELSQSMRAVVRDQLAAGKSPDEVKDYFVSKYGEWILLAPAAHGFNIVAYALPVLVVVGGCVLIAIAVRRWTGAKVARSDVS
ncbi:MAG: cytochrome c-type biogenesis protein CcmH [Gemmatimonadaceae bacterium]